MIVPDPLNIAPTDMRHVHTVHEHGDPGHGRIVVEIAPPWSFDGDHWPVILVSRHRDGEVDARAIGMSPRAALELAATLAAVACAFCELDS